jgi:hypothetical protein
MDRLHAVLSWLQTNASWLQVIAALAQAFAAVAAIPIAVLAANRGAERGARRAFELSEKQERARLDDQVKLLRFLVNLEIQRNLDELERFYNNFPIALDDEEGHGATVETPDLLDLRQRFIALHLPDLSYRFWHSQQLSSLLPVALTQSEISEVNLAYTKFDRLTKIRAMFAERAGPHGQPSSQGAGERVGEGAGLLLSSKELKDLSSEFDETLRDTLERGNPFANVVEETDSAKCIPGAAGNSRMRLQPRRQARLEASMKK